MRRSIFISVFFLLLSQHLFAETKVPGYRGDIPALEGQTIGSMAIRSDGRYLFYNLENANELKILDLLDFARTKTLATLTNPIISVFLFDDQRLAVVTTKTIEYFVFEEPLSVKQDPARTNFPQVTDYPDTHSRACALDNGKIYILRSDDKILPVLDSTSEIAFSWNLESNSGYELLSFKCTKDTFFVFSRKKTGDIYSNFNLWTSGKLSQFTLKDLDPRFESELFHYDLQDYILTKDKDKLLLLFRKNPAAGNKDDSIVKIINVPGFSIAAGSQSLGQTATAMTSYWNDEDSQVGFFVGTDDLGGSNKFLSSPLGNLFSVDPFGEAAARGTGIADAGGTIPTHTISSKADYYKILRTKATGLSLISAAPLFQVRSFGSQSLVNGVPTLTGANPLTFTLNYETELNYQIRFIEDEDTISLKEEIIENPGRVIKEGEVLKEVNQEGLTNFSISHSDLNIKKQGFHSLIIFGRDVINYQYGTTSGALPVARLGIRFNYDPPPEKISDLQLGFGDQSISASFRLPVGEDIKTIKIFLAQNETDAASITSSRTIQTVNGSISSPIEIPMAEWSGSYIMSPLANELPIYVAAYAIDNTNQIGELSDILNITPHATLTLAQAFGSTASCSLQIGAPNDIIHLVIILILVSLILVMLRRSKKLGPAHLRNRRGGD